MKKLILILIGFLLIAVPVLASFPDNCTDTSPRILFKYRVPLKNVTATSSYENITYATCNITVYQKERGVDNVINSTEMFHSGFGFYDCIIPSNFPKGKYNTFYSCNTSDFVVSDYGRFEVIPDDVPLTIILFLLSVAGLFLFYSIKLEDKMAALRVFFFLLTLLFIFIIFAITFSIIDEEGAGSNLIDMSRTVYIAYTYLFTFLVFYVVITFILNVVSMFMTKKREKKDRGINFD